MRLSYRPLLLALASLGFLAFAPAVEAAPNPPPPFPAAGDILGPRLAVRAAPDTGAKRVMTMRQFRDDYRPTIVHAIRQRRDGEGTLWYQIRLPLRPYGQKGWVLATNVDVYSVAERVVVRRASRVLEVWRGKRRIYRTRVAVGRPDRPTPVGRFYVAAKYVPARNAFVSTYALELSAPAGLSDFPGGGVVGIHGTPARSSIGTAASSGCVRVMPRAALRLRKIVPLGAPVQVVAR